jgi:hypothetical protein
MKSFLITTAKKKGTKFASRSMYKDREDIADATAGIKLYDHCCCHTQRAGCRKTLDDEWCMVKQATTPAAAAKELDRAETDLSDAEQRLTGARTDLREAERRLRAANVAGPSVDAWLEAGVARLHLRTPDFQRFKRMGRDGFDRELAACVSQLTRSP